MADKKDDKDEKMKLKAKEDKEDKKEEVEKLHEEPDGDEAEKELEIEDDDEEDSDEEKKKKKKAKKSGPGLDEDPEDSAKDSKMDAHTISPSDKGGQNVFVPSSSVKVDRDVKSDGATKSVNIELMKSPLFNELSSQLTEMQKAFDKRLESMEKSFKDRSENLQKSIGKVEEFYKKPFYKSVNENVGAEQILKEGINAQIEKGKVRYSN